jgi:hypothetical protein
VFESLTLWLSKSFIPIAESSEISMIEFGKKPFIDIISTDDKDFQITLSMNTYAVTLTNRQCCYMAVIFLCNDEDYYTDQSTDTY